MKVDFKTLASLSQFHLHIKWLARSPKESYSISFDSEGGVEKGQAPSNLFISGGIKSISSSSASFLASFED
jgi:hypothetical protein